MSSSFPNHAGSRYRSVNVGMMRWEKDTLGVDSELNTLRDVFEKQYGFNVETWHIPTTEKSHNKLTQNALDFIEDFDSEENLFILYYAATDTSTSTASQPGHGNGLQTLKEPR